LNEIIQLIFITPTPSASTRGNLIGISNAIKSICEDMHSLPEFDLFKCSGFNLYNYNKYYYDGSVYPNGSGYRIMSRKTVNYIKQVIA